MKLLQVLALFFITGLSLSLQAQTVYNNDCLNVFLAGRFVCGNAAFAQDNLHGRGINDFGSQFQNNPGCLGTSGMGGFIEAQSAWYAIRIQAGGTLTMDIIPTNNASYNFDFAIFGPNKPCHALGVPIRCSYANPRFPNWYKTGMSMLESHVSEGSTGFGYVRYMDVLPGQMYYILINSYDGFNSGFSLTWGGTAKLAVSYADFKASVSCNVATFINSSTVCDGSLGYEWDFGDGSPITSENYERNPRHHYATVGTYQAKLRITVVSSSSPTNVGVKDSLTLPVVITKVPPAVQSLSIKTAYCADEPAVLLSATPAGGTFSLKKNQTGSYIDITTLDIPALGVGKHELRYVVQDFTDLACKSYKVWLIEVFPAVTAQFTNLPASLCLNASPLTLTGTPAGGTFTVDGQPATVLNPALLSIGTHNLAYTYTAPQGACSNTDTRTIEILPLPALTFVGLKAGYCLLTPPVELNATPPGGSFKVNGGITGVLDIPALGVGKHQVRYSFTNGCESEIGEEVEIFPMQVFTPVEEKAEVCPYPAYRLTALSTAEESAFISQGILPTYAWAHTAASLREIALTSEAEAGKYSVIVRDQYGCPVAEKRFEIAINCTPTFEVPTAFTPNTDQKNETLQIFGKDFIKLDFKVYNRWGEVVFTARQKSETWDGTIKGQPAPAGIYAWSATFENVLKRGEVIRKQGQFSLMR